jgi:hypothetical protein
VGGLEGTCEGLGEGEVVGDKVGATGNDVGTRVGPVVGETFGEQLEVTVGILVGDTVGEEDGILVGHLVGARGSGLEVGVAVGPEVGVTEGDGGNKVQPVKIYVAALAVKVLLHTILLRLSYIVIEHPTMRACVVSALLYTVSESKTVGTVKVNQAAAFESELHMLFKIPSQQNEAA